MIYPLGLVNTKKREFFFVSSFVLLLAYASTMFLCLCLCRSICRRLHCFVLPFVCPYAYASSVNQALQVRKKAYYPRTAPGRAIRFFTDLSATNQRAPCVENKLSHIIIMHLKLINNSKDFKKPPRRSLDM